MSHTIRRNSLPRNFTAANMANLVIPPFGGYRNPKTSSSTSSGIQPLEQEEVKIPAPSESQKQSQGSTHFLDKEPVMPPYQGGKIKSVKIKPMDRNLFFDGTNMTIKTFIRRYEDAADTDGASERDLAKQIIPFIKGMDLKEEVEEMSGYEDCNWTELKKQLLNRFGSSLPLVKYTRQDLRNLIRTASENGGIKTLEQFKMFRSKYENITHYLHRMGYISNVEECREGLLEMLNPDLEMAVTRELIRDNKMLVSKDGGDILPETATLISYIHREVQTASVMQRRQIVKTGGKPEQIRTLPAPHQGGNQDKAMDDLTKTLANWNVQKAKPTPFISSRHVPYTPAQNDRPNFQCHYCHMIGHGTVRCNIANVDELQGRIVRDGKEIKLPDGSKIPFDRTRPMKIVVDQYAGKLAQPGIISLPPGTQIQPQATEEKVPEAQTSFGKLEEIESVQSASYECDATKRLRSGREVVDRPSVKKSRAEKDEVMDIEAERIMEIARQDDPDPEPVYSPLEGQVEAGKKVQFKTSDDSSKVPKEKAPRTTPGKGISGCRRESG